MRLIPDLDRLGSVGSTAELRLAKLLAQAELPEPATCLYSVHLPAHEYKRMSEVDFLAVWDDTVLVIEVKGGRLGRHGGTWTVTDRYGEVTEKREGPFEQARSAMFALEARLQERIPALDVAFGYLVVTPDQELGDDLEWDPQQHVGFRSMTVSGVEKALEESRRFWKLRARRPVRGGAYRELLRVLRPDFDRLPTLRSSMVNLESEYVRLADRQYDLLLGAERNRRVLCIGGAGSGKTLLAVETARRAARQGYRVMLTCRSEPLARMLREQLRDTDVICVSFDDALGGGTVDMLVVDEAQDILNVESLLELDELVDGGWSGGRWRVFCDPNNQANVDGTFDRVCFDELAALSSVVELPFNCRNTATVVHQTQMVTAADLGVARAGEGPPVEYKRCSDKRAVAAVLDAQLKRLRKDEVDLAEVVVVTMCDRVSDSSATASKAYRTGRLVAAAGGFETTANAALLVTAAEIKGLEAAHVCIVDVDDVHDPVSRARLYVAMTRPRISLWLALSDQAWRQIAEGPTSGGAN
ncbi:NERD domain-containing protein [Micromonospora sp. WMMD967]|uniref:nuclease-related domain-containing DEAD/DEAH box helicase n=1 Tax=Micromonospora sp. WMMD967 TaxID=3016101 RepID=UPI002417149E|nr:NERD domain-containing protein [Micromonospora sp. WMMD967]MDG4836927.1 NERD domain-containing protein [Micromonospora sp. WMMD967]